MGRNWGLWCVLLIGSMAMADDASPYLTVNGRPQLSVDGRNFGFYWALWRTLTPAERTALEPQGGGHLVSRRKISWKSRGCGAKDAWVADSEDLWYWDKIEWNEQGKIKPLQEAPWSDHLYLVMGNLNSARVSGSRGEFLIHSEQAIVPKDRGPRSREFITIDDYGPNRPDALMFLEVMHPDQWPVYYDERAHKPHSLHRPALWGERAQWAISQTSFDLRLVWDACSRTGGLRVRALVPPGGLPGPGPNRFGRDEDAGRDDLEWVETPDWRTAGL